MKAKFLLLLQAAAIILAGTWVYAPALHGDWLWDDGIEVARNPIVREPAGAVGRIWFAPEGADYFPLKTTVQWAEWHLWGDNRFGYHLTSLALHLLSALLFWRLLRRLFALGGGGQGGGGQGGGEFGPWLGGLIFAIHPLAVESVAWISELKNTLSLPFLLGAMIAYLDYDGAWEVASGDGGGDARPGASGRWRNPKRTRAGGTPAPISSYLLSLFLFLLAMLSKSSVVMFPGVLLLYGWWRRGRIGRRDLVASLPFFAVSLGLGLVTLWFQHHRAIGGSDLAIGGWPSRIAGAGLAIVFYLGKFAWPAGLLPIYPRWHLTPPSAAQFLPWAVIAAAAGWLWRRRGREELPGWERTALFGLGCFGVNLLPVLGFVPMAYLRISWAADHFVYLPMLGLIGLVAAGAGTAVAAGRARSRPGLGVPLAVFIAGACALLAFAGHRHASIFRNEETLWSHTLRGNPDSWTAHDNLGLALDGPGRTAEAIAQFQAALHLTPNDPRVHFNLGLALGAAGRIPEAIDQFEETLRIKPDYPGAHDNLGLALQERGDFPGAILRFRDALRLAPDDPRVHFSLGVALDATGRADEAIAQYREALRLAPAFAEAHNDLGVALREIGRTDEAIAQFQAALRARPAFAAAHNNLGLAQGATGRMAEAVESFQRALRLDPGNAETHYNLAMALGAAGRAPEAKAEFEEAARLRAVPPPSR